MPPSDAMLAEAPDGAAVPEEAVVEEPAEEILVTISKAADGTFMVRPGAADAEMPAPGGADTAAGGMGETPDGGGPEMVGTEPVAAKTVGEALKAALDILQNAGAGDPEQTAAQEDEDFEAGYSGDKAPTLTQKY